MVFNVLVYSQVIASCLALEPYVRDSHWFYFGVDFPYHYSIAQAEKESKCIHHVLSTDGIGSEGFAQITYRWWKEKLDKEGIPEIKSLKNHARAQAYINFEAYRQSACKKLFEMYQIYNGGKLVSKEIFPECKWQIGKERCRRKDVCVMFKRGECVQYRNACDINYGYSEYIYKRGQV
ncbi:MAG: hypothetical protein ACK4ZR_03785, partial [Aquificaceae bacterium]